MSTVPFSALYDQLRLHAKRISVPAMNLAIRRAARQLCAETGFRRLSISIDVIQGQFIYPIPAPAGEEVLRIEAAQYNNPNQPNCPMPLAPVTAEQVTTQSFQSGWPCWFYLEPPSQIVIGPFVPATVVKGLYVRGILQPTMTAAVLDAGLVQHCDRAITAGALAWALAMNDEPWTNLPLAAKFDGEFRRLSGRAETAVGTGFQAWNLTSSMYRY